MAYRVKFQNKFLRKHAQSPEEAKIFSPGNPFSSKNTTGTCGLSCGHWPKLEYLS